MGSARRVSVPQHMPNPKRRPLIPQGNEDEAEGSAEGESYQLEMMRCLREVNVDNNMVGWYQSTVSGSYQVVEIIDTFVNYLENLDRCICIVYDTLAASSGSLGLKAIRLSDSFVTACREGASGAVVGFVVCGWVGGRIAGGGSAAVVAWQHERL